MSNTKQALQEIKRILKEAGWADDRSVNVGGDVVNSQVGQTLTKCKNIIHAQPAGERRARLEDLQATATALMEKLPDEQRDEAARTLETLVQEMASPKPRRKWVSLSAEGLLEAAKFAKDFTGNIAGPIVSLGKAIWPDFNISG